jgi:hypothetical protein
MQPGRFTELFFLDEATALAAGHRPCALCRRKDYDDLTAFWRELYPGEGGADTIDARLHSERLDSRREAALDDLPDAAFVLWDEEPRLVLGERLLRWTPAGYEDPLPRPRGVHALLVTPPSLVALLRTDREPLVPLLHPTAAA